MKSTPGNSICSILIIAMVLFLAQCGKESISPGKEFTDYIKVYNTGEISRNSAIRIEFQEDIKFAVPDEQADPKLFVLSPPVPGNHTLTLIDDLG